MPTRYRIVQLKYGLEIRTQMITANTQMPRAACRSVRRRTVPGIGLLDVEDELFGMPSAIASYRPRSPFAKRSLGTVFTWLSCFGPCLRHGCEDPGDTRE